MNTDQQRIVSELRGRGFAVVVLPPEQLRGHAGAAWVEGKMLQYAYDCLIPDAEAPTKNQ